MVKDIPNKEIAKLGIIKHLTKPITNYGKELLDGTHGGYPGHINALLRANEEYGFEVEVGDKFFVIPILTSETEGKKKIKRKRVTIAFSIEEGLPPQYKIDYEYYLRSNLFGKINELFEMKPKDLEKEIIDEEMKKVFGIEEVDNESCKNRIN
jgi:DNA polymerase elongation subunit (family B)